MRHQTSVHQNKKMRLGVVASNSKTTSQESGMKAAALFGNYTLEYSTPKQKKLYTDEYKQSSQL